MKGLPVQTASREPLERPSWSEMARETHMTDKHRHRQQPTPKGYLPNWVLVVSIAAAAAVVSLARSFV
jgi:hypothetical protein